MCVLGETKLPYLSELHVGNLITSTSFLTNLLQALSINAGNIESLYFSNLSINDSGPFTLERLRLNKLVSLELMHSVIKAETLSIMLQIAPNLETLNLMHLNLSGGGLILQEGSLPHLISINLTGAKVSEENLIVLLKAAPNLSVLKGLRMTVSNSSPLRKTSFSLPHIEEVNMRGSQLSGFLFENICHSPGKLKSLNLERCSKIISAISKDFSSVAVSIEGLKSL